MISILPFLIIFGTALMLSSQNDLKRKAREEEEALQLEGEIRSETLLAITSADDEEDFWPHTNVCDNIVACDLTDKI